MKHEWAHSDIGRRQQLFAWVNPVTGRQGVMNMGRNIVFKLTIPLEFGQ